MRYKADYAQLEERVMLSATPLAELALLSAEAGADDGSLALQSDPMLSAEALGSEQSDATEGDGSTGDDLQLVDGPSPREEQPTRLEVAFVDTTVDDFQQLVDDLLENADPDRELEIYLLDSSRDGVEQIASILAGHENVEALHLISHGAEGRVKLGSTWLHSGNVESYAADLSRWNFALEEGADLMLYGCEVAGSAEGRALVESLGLLAGCDVAASDDLTGHASLGGDWSLEYAVGVLDAEVVVSSQLQHSWLVTLEGGPPTITSDATPTVDENVQAVHTLTATSSGESGSVTFTITGGVDQSFFRLDGSNNLSFYVAPDFEAPGDADGDNVYLLEVTATNNDGSTVQSMQVTVAPLNEHRPVFSTPRDIYVAENSTLAETIVATDADAPAPTLTYSITGGNDAGKFTIDASTGDLTFNTAPDYEAPGDQNADNQYNVDITVDDGGGFSEVLQANVYVTDVDESPTFTSSATADVVENQTAVLTVTATHPTLPPEDITYSISGGADAARFALDGTTGELTFAAAPDYEAPSDAGGDNVYDVEVTATASDGNSSVQTLQVTVTATNDNSPVFTTPATASVAENSTFVRTVAATDDDAPAQTILYAIAGGADAALFTIDAATGELSFAAAPNYEAPTDAGGNNVYDVDIRADDGNGGTTLQSIAVTVTDANDAPVFTSAAATSVPEGSSDILLVLSATDEDGHSVDYSIVGGADASLFWINGGNKLKTTANLDFENPEDADLDNVYEIQLQASDGNGGTTLQTLVLTVTPVNEYSPVFTSSATVTVDENTTAVQTVSATDADRPAQTISYSISGGADAALFTIDAATGELAFATAPDYEAPADNNGDNVYEVSVTADDGDGRTSTQTVQVTVAPVNEHSPSITSSATVSVDENTTAVQTVTATDADLPAPSFTYSIQGGADAGLFTIDAATGELAFIAAPDYESPADADSDNVYEVDVLADDGSGGSDTQSIQVTVTAVNEYSPVFTSSPTVTIDENSTAVQTVSATDADLPAQTLSYSLQGGADAASFTIDAATGELAFAVAPDYEAPADADGDNVYEVSVTADDGEGRTSTQTVQVTVAPVDEHSPSITSSATVSVDENTTAVQTVTATDADLPAQSFTYSIQGGADAGLFTIDAATGELAFIAAPNYESPTDADSDNVYEVDVLADDGSGGTDTQSIQVTVTAVNEYSPVFTSSATVTVDENSTAVQTVSATDADLPAQTLSYSISGGADAASFTIDAATGELVFAVAPDYEAPADTDGDNVYEVSVVADDGSGRTATQALQVTVSPVEDNAPVFTSSPTVSVSEGTTSVQTVSATDADLPTQTLSYSISGGADAALFTIDAATGELAFAAAPDYKAAGDADGNNVYVVDVQVDDGNGGTTTQSVSVEVTDVNEAPVITSPAAVAVAENQSIVTTVTSSDIDGGAATYSIQGGADAGRFTVDAATGELRWASPPDFEQPADANADNVYEVTVQVADGRGGSDLQSVQVSVTDANDAPVAAGESYHVYSNDRLVITAPGILANDSDQDGDVLSTALSAGPAHGSLTLNADGSFVYTPASSFSGTDSFTYTASDGRGGTATAVVTITVERRLAGPVVAPPAEPTPQSPEPADSSDSPDSSDPGDSGDSTDSGNSGDSGDSGDSSSDSSDSSSSENGSVSPGAVAGAVPQSSAQTASGGAAGPQATAKGDTARSSVSIASLSADELPGTEGAVTALGSGDRSESAAERAEREMARAQGYAGGDFATASYDTALLWNDLEDLRKDLGADDDLTFLAAGSAAGVTSSFTVGYVLWTIRSGWLVTSLLAHMPAWSMVDPLAVLEYLDDEEEAGQGEDDSLESLLAQDGGEDATVDSALPQSDDTSASGGGVRE